MKKMLFQQDPITQRSMFSKESLQTDEVEMIINSGESSSRSSNIQIDQYYVRIFSVKAV